jgi:hypothetical protein
MRFLPLVGLIFFSILRVNGQPLISSDQIIKEERHFAEAYSTQTAFIDSLYFHRVDVSDELINGREYVPYYFKSKVKPLIADTRIHTGTLIFAGRKYDNLDLDYDTYLDQLIYSDKSKLINDKVFMLALNWNAVGGFIISFGADSMLFRHLGGSSTRNFNLPEAFYEIIYEGKTRFIVRHQSFLLEKEGLYEYTYTPVKYMETSEGFVKIKSSSAFLKAFGKDADELRKFMRSNKIRYRNAGKNDIAAVLRFYDNLTATKN